MPNYDPYGGNSSYYDDEDQFNSESFMGAYGFGGGFGNYPVWNPGDPEDPFGLSMHERLRYNQEVGNLASRLTANNLGSSAIARGPSGFGTAYAPAHLLWAGGRGWEPKSRVNLGVWGYDENTVDDPFPILGGKIITPTIDIYPESREPQFDEYGRAIDSGQTYTRSEITTGRVRVGEIMTRSNDRGIEAYERAIKQGLTPQEARVLGERAARESVRFQTSSFPSDSFGKNWGWTHGLRSAMAGAININMHGEYGVGPKQLFGVLRNVGSGYFTRATSPSEDEEHPERGAWEAYSLSSLYELGWFRTQDGAGFITGTSKPEKRRQLGVQNLAQPMGADSLMRTGRLTGDRMLTTTAIFLDNYAYSEGSGVVDPTLVTGFRDFRPIDIDRPSNADESWDVRFSNVSKRHLGIARKLGFDRPGDFGAPGENVYLGEQYLDGQWQPLGDVAGRDAVQQRVYGYRKTQSGFQALIESISPFESGTAKVMHHGLKALLFQSSSIIKRAQDQVYLSQMEGDLPSDVRAPRMVLPMPKDWLQNYRGMFDFLDDQSLIAMGITQNELRSRDWQRVGPGVVDKLARYAEQHRISYNEHFDVPVDRLGAFLNADKATPGLIVGGQDAIQYSMKNGTRYAAFDMKQTGYVLPVAVGMRMEHPGKSPMYSPEELMQLRKFYPRLAERMASQSNSASRIWGLAVAAAEGTVPQGAISHEQLPWMMARLDENGKMDTGGPHQLIANLAREMRQNKQVGPIIGPGGILMPNPNDMLSQSVMGYSGQEQSQFMASYLNTMKLLGKNEDATEAATKFAAQLQTFASGHNLRRQALGAKLSTAIEGTFTSHVAIPDDVVVVGTDALRKLANIRQEDPEYKQKMKALTDYLEGGKNNMYAIGTRRPISDMFSQLGTPSKVITEEMARRIYGVEIENLGRSFAVSPTMAAIWRGDVDADRALLQAVSEIEWTNVDGKGGATIHTNQEILDEFYKETLLSRGVSAIRNRAPEAYDNWIKSQDADTQRLVRQGLKADGRSDAATIAMSRALHGIKVDWNEAQKWSDELRLGNVKNAPHDYAYYSDPRNGTVFTRDAMLAEFEKKAKSKVLMGRGYNRYLRGLTSLARNEEELQASVTLASNVYQKALDVQPMTEGEILMFNLFESMGPSGAIYDKFGSEQGYVSGGSAFTGGPAGMIASITQAALGMNMPRETLATLFSRDESVANAIRMGGGQWDVLRSIGKGRGGRETEAAISFLEDTERAGILPQLVQALHYSKGSIKLKTPAEEQYAARGQSIRDMIAIVGRSYKDKTTNNRGEETEFSGLAPKNAARMMRNMAGLDTLGWWREKMARRMGFGDKFFASDEDIEAEMRSKLPSFNNPALPGEEFPAYISEKEAAVLEGLRQMPIVQAQKIAAAVSQPPQYTPKNGAPSFDTGSHGWDKTIHRISDYATRVASSNIGSGVVNKALDLLSEYAVRGAWNVLDHAPNSLLSLGIGLAGKFVERIRPDSPIGMAAGQLGHFMLGRGKTRNLKLPEYIEEIEGSGLAEALFRLGLNNNAKLTTDMIHKYRGKAFTSVSKGTPEEVGWENAHWTVGVGHFNKVVGGYYTKYDQGSDTIRARDWYDWHSTGSDENYWLTQQIDLPGPINAIIKRGMNRMAPRLQSEEDRSFGVPFRIEARSGLLSLTTGRGVNFTVSDKFWNDLGTPFLAQWNLSSKSMLAAAERLGMKEDEVPSFKNPAFSEDEFPAYISEKEASVLEGLRQMPIVQAQRIAATIGQAPRFTPKNGVPSFNTGSIGWDKLSREQKDEIIKMRRNNASDEDIRNTMSRFAQSIFAQQAQDLSSNLGSSTSPASNLSGQLPRVGPKMAVPFEEYIRQREAQGIDASSLSREKYEANPAYVQDPIYDDEDPFAGAPDPFARAEANPEINDQYTQNAAGENVERRVPAKKRVFRLDGRATPGREYLEGVLERMRRGEHVDLTKNPGVITLLQHMAASGGRKVVGYFQQYNNGSFQFRASFEELGLMGHGQDLYKQLIDTGMAEGYSENYQKLEREAYLHSGIGQGLVRAARNVIDADINQLDSRGAARMRDDVAKITKALGLGEEDRPLSGEASTPLGKKIDELTKRTAELSEVQKQHLDLLKDRIGGSSGYAGAMRMVQDLAAASVQDPASFAMSPEQIKKLKIAKSLSDIMSDGAADDIDKLFSQNDINAALRTLGDIEEGALAGRSGIRGRAMNFANRALSRLSSGRAEGESSFAENMFSEMALGMQVFRARMIWGLTTGQTSDWMNSFMREQQSAVGAALSGGSTPMSAGASSQFASARASIENTKASLGEGVAQVYAPLMSMIGDMRAGSVMGAGATLLGTPFGIGSVAAIGTDIIGRAADNKAIRNLRGPIGFGTAMVTAGVLGTSYLGGLAENWMTARDDSTEQSIGRSIRPAQLAAEEAGLPTWVGTIFGGLVAASSGARKIGGPLALLPNKSIQEIYSGFLPKDPNEQNAWTRAMQKFALEGSGVAPGTLQGDVNRLRDWADSKYHGRIPIPSVLEMAGSLMQLSGGTTRELYEGKSQVSEQLLDYWANYVEAGADPSSLYSSQVQAAAAAGVPLGPQTTQFMLDFAKRIPGNLRTSYEQAYQSLSSIPSTLGRPTTELEAQKVVNLSGKYGNLGRAVREVESYSGVGWFTSAFGVQPGSSVAKMMGVTLGGYDLPTQETIQQLAGMTSQSFSRAGIPPQATSAFLGNLAQTHGDNVIGVSSLIVQAESVSLQTGQDFLGLINKGLAGGYDAKTSAEQRWFLSAQAGITGLTPQAYTPMGAQARAFDSVFENLPTEKQAAYQLAASILNQMQPAGYSTDILTQTGEALYGEKATVPQVTMREGAMRGKAGLAPSFGIAAGSMPARVLETGTIGWNESALNLTNDQLRGLAGAINPSMFQYMSGNQIAQLAPAISDLYKGEVWPGNMSAHQFGRAVEFATGSTPWGYSAQRGFGPGSLTDRLGRQYGMYSGDPGSRYWTASNGQQYLPLFDLQMSAGWASLAAQSASLPIEHRTFERQQAAKRLEWGSGPYQSYDTVQAAMFPEPGSQVEAVQPGAGMQVGQSTIGLAQQEAVIRRQMWQENIAYQQQSIGFARQGLEIAKQELALSKEQYGAQREYNLSERGANRAMQMRQREWATEDFTIRMERMGIGQQWQMEDLQRARRYATGRERVDIERNIQRTMLTQGWERDDANRGRNRELELQRHQDARYEAAVAFEEKLNEFQMRRFALQDQRMALEEAKIAAQEAHLNNQASLQEKLQKIEEDRFKFQYDQAQAQMKDDETLEKLRQDVRKAELAYQAAQLANAETLQKAQEDWMTKLEEGKTSGVLDKWIDFFRVIQYGPPTPPDGGTGGGTNPTKPGPQETEARSRRLVVPEAKVGQELTRATQPTIVNFVLDGEVVMQAVVKPERLRPVVEEINRRSRLR